MSERDETREAVARAIRVIPQPHHEGRWIIAFEGGSLTGWSYPSEAEAQDALDTIRAALHPRPGSRFTVEGVECVVVDWREWMILTADERRKEHLERWLKHPEFRAMLRACEEKGDG